MSQADLFDKRDYGQLNAMKGWMVSVWKKDCVRVVKRESGDVMVCRNDAVGITLGVYFVGFSLAAFELLTRVGRLIAICKIVARIRIVLFGLLNVSDDFCKWQVGQGRPWQNRNEGNKLRNYSRSLSGTEAVYIFQTEYWIVCRLEVSMTDGPIFKV